MEEPLIRFSSSSTKTKNRFALSQDLLLIHFLKRYKRVDNLYYYKQPFCIMFWISVFHHAGRGPLLHVGTCGPRYSRSWYPLF